MKKIKVLALTCVTLCSIFFLLAHADETGPNPLPQVADPVIVMDKKTNQMHITNYNDGHLDIVKSFHATIGLENGDKLMEGDLKTPEGIYDFLYRARAPQLKPIFGPLAIYVSYPNAMDKRGQKTGFDILVHGTDDPSRLEKAFDSKGCMVLDNANVKTISDVVTMRKTKIIVTKDFSALQNTPRLALAKEFFHRWVDAWSNKNLTTYIESYADEYRSDGMNRRAFANYKKALNSKYETIKVTAEDVHYYFHEKYDLITFTQNYSSTFPGGKPAYHGRSKKNLWIQQRNGQYRIVIEESVK